MYTHNLKWIGFNIFSGKFQFKNHCLSGLLQWSSEKQWHGETQENTLAPFGWAFEPTKGPKSHICFCPKAAFVLVQN